MVNRQSYINLAGPAPWDIPVSKGSSTVTCADCGCRAHAADVLHTVHCTLYCGGLVSSGFVSKLEVLACYIAAVVHDVEHPGTHPPSTC